MKNLIVLSLLLSSVCVWAQSPPNTPNVPINSRVDAQFLAALDQSAVTKKDRLAIGDEIFKGTVTSSDGAIGTGLAALFSIESESVCRVFRAGVAFGVAQYDRNTNFAAYASNVMMERGEVLGVKGALVAGKPLIATRVYEFTVNRDTKRVTASDLSGAMLSPPKSNRLALGDELFKSTVTSAGGAVGVGLAGMLGIQNMSNHQVFRNGVLIGLAKLSANGLIENATIGTNVYSRDAKSGQWVARAASSN